MEFSRAELHLNASLLSPSPVFVGSMPGYSTELRRVNFFFFGKIPVRVDYEFSFGCVSFYNNLLLQARRYPYDQHAVLSIRKKFNRITLISSL